MRHVVIGGGIAGVVAAEELCRLRPGDAVALVSASTVLKGVDAVVRISKTIEEVTVVERDLASLAHPNLRVVQGLVRAVDTQQRLVQLQGGEALPYDRLCIAAGARPKVLPFAHERIVSLRDVQSVEGFARQLASARRIAVIGNGGIALELVGAARGVEVVWVLKHGHIGDAFFDLDAAEFLLGVLQQQQQQEQQQQGQQEQQQQQQEQQQQQQQQQQAQEQEQQQGQQQEQQGQQEQQQQGQQEQQQQQQQQQAQQAQQAQQEQQEQQPPPPEQPGQPAAVAEAGTAGAAAAAAARGHAAGPKWVDQLPRGALPAHVRLERNAQVVGASSAPQQAPPVGPGAERWPLYLRLSSGKEVGVDLAVQAIGVEPATDWLPAELRRAPDGGVLVDENLESSVPGVFAAGDCCTVDPGRTAAHWFQMRLWTQARLMGLHAAAGMAGARDDEVLSLSFELVRRRAPPRGAIARRPAACRARGARLHGAASQRTVHARRAAGAQFTHVTRFLGFKVVLLGLYNGQKLSAAPRGDVVLYSRADGAQSFVRVLLLRGRLAGAVLLGETGLEETFENLILDGLDLSGYGPALLDPDAELDHIFD
ncbi:PYROXD1 [Scenedesmus sp. PABB004]|nr:PYROXD1 [Scenedesmus sp. PABB004]